jgi:hypothetical protein
MLTGPSQISSVAAGPSSEIAATGSSTRAPIAPPERAPAPSSEERQHADGEARQRADDRREKFGRRRGRLPLHLGHAAEHEEGDPSHREGM